MPIGTDQFRDERKALETLIGSTPLHTDRRLPDSSGQGLAAAHDPRDRLQVLEYGDLRLPETLEGYDLHRHFQVHAVGFEQLRAGQMARPSEKMLLRCTALFAYATAREGDAYGGTPTQAGEVAIEDLKLVYQRLMHPDNRTAGTGTNVTRPSTDIVLAGPATLTSQTATLMVWTMPIVSRVEITTEAAGG